MKIEKEELILQLEKKYGVSLDFCQYALVLDAMKQAAAAAVLDSRYTTKLIENDGDVKS